MDSSRYPYISDHGLIGDLQTAALVTIDGPVDWFCARGSTRRASSRGCSMRGVVMRSGGMELTLHAAALGRHSGETTEAAHREGDGLRAIRTMREGQTSGVVLDSMGGKPRTSRPPRSPGWETMPPSSGAAG